MSVHRAYRHRLRVTPEQERALFEILGCRRLVYNLALEAMTMSYELYGRSPSKYELYVQLTELKHTEGVEWLKDPPIACLRAGIDDLFYAFNSFYRGRTAYPKYKKRSLRDACRFTTGVKFDPDRPGWVSLSKIGWIELVNSYPRLRDSGRLYEGELGSVTVRREADGWYASFGCRLESASEAVNYRPLSVGPRPAVGIDVGIARSVSLSTGEFHKIAVMTEQQRAHLAVLDRRLARCRIGSQNRRKAQDRLARYHQRLHRRREDSLHRISTTLAREHGMIAAEQLAIQAMTASAAGTAEEPGSGVARKSGLNREILNQSWGRLFEMLQYKTGWYDGDFVRVTPNHTSRRCPECTYTSKENRKSQAAFSCVGCGHSDNADAVAARNVLAKALASVGGPLYEMLHEQKNAAPDPLPKPESTDERMPPDALLGLDPDRQHSPSPESAHHKWFSDDRKMCSVEELGV